MSSKTMVMHRSSVPLSLLFYPFLLLNSIAPTHQTQGKRTTAAAALFVFGDSFLDAGNNNYINTTTLDQANFWPYGETFFRFPTGRFSDGRLPSDFIAGYAGLPFITPYLQPGAHEWCSGANFASAGAGALVETFRGSVIDMRTQLGFFKEVETQLRSRIGDVETGKTLSSAVYMISIGSNDYLSPFLTNKNISISKLDYVGMVIGNLSTIIQGIHERGGRKFAFLNVPPLGCLPGMRILTKPGIYGRCCLEEASLLASLHNQALVRLLVKLEKQLEGLKYSLFDTNSVLGWMMEDPSKYGLTEVAAACCGTGEFRGVFSCGGKRTVKEFEVCEDPSRHLFWDSYHPTEAGYKLISYRMWNGDDANGRVAGPYTVEQLFDAP